VTQRGKYVAGWTARLTTAGWSSPMPPARQATTSVSRPPRSNEALAGPHSDWDDYFRARVDDRACSAESTSSTPNAGGA
jgi:hypothetical protein